MLFGVGPHGICPFEKMLFGKAAGERFTMEIGTGAEREIFGHLNGLLSSALGEKPPYQLQGEVLSIASAADHELVKAMAEYSGCGGGCGCGCGG